MLALSRLAEGMKVMFRPRAAIRTNGPSPDACGTIRPIAKALPTKSLKIEQHGCRLVLMFHGVEDVSVERDCGDGDRLI
jgi:hypothetical protein